MKISIKKQSITSFGSVRKEGENRGRGFNPRSERQKRLAIYAAKDALGIPVHAGRPLGSLGKKRRKQKLHEIAA